MNHPVEIMLEWWFWIARKRSHTCTCGHVEWAHHRNRKCAHCKCDDYDGKPNPLEKSPTCVQESKMKGRFE